MKKDSPLAQKMEINPDDLLPYPILVAGRSIVRNELANWFGDAYDRLNIIGSYNLIYNAATMVEADLGYALCLEKLIPESEDSPLCFKLLDPVLETGFVIAWKKYQTFPPVVAKFVEELKNAFKA